MYRKGYKKKYPRKSMGKADKALRIAKSLQAKSHSELKTHDGGITAAVGTTWQITYLTTVPQGDGFAQREGRSVKLKSLNMRCKIDIASLASFSNLRIMIVRRPVMDGSALTNMNQVNLTTDFYSLRNLSRTNEYKVCFDKTYTVSHTNVRPTINLLINKQLNDVLQYSDGNSSGVETECRKNAYYLCILSDTSVGPPTFDCKYRFRYYDN